MKFLVYIQFVLVVLIFHISTYKSAKVDILSTSHIAIQGSTNVNSFSCIYKNEIQLSDNVVNYFIEESQIKLKDTELLLSTSAFDCGNKGMNKDFKSLLNAEKYENIKIKVLSIIPDNDCVYVIADIKISGFTKEYKFIVNASDDGSFKGSLDLNICDFGMKPPTKMLGLVKVDETITIDFDVSFKINKH